MTEKKPIEAIFGAAQNPGGAFKYQGTQHDTIGIGRLSELPEGTDVREVIRDFYGTAASAVDAMASVKVEGEDKKPSTTLTTVAITPDGNITHATLGDSPLIAFVLDKDHKVIRTEMLNKPDNRDPWETHINYSTVNTRDYQERIANLTTGEGWGTQNVNDLLGDRGEYLIIVPASDGLTEGATPAWQTLKLLPGEASDKRKAFDQLPERVKDNIRKAAFAEVDTNTASTLHYLGRHVEGALSNGLNAQAVADQLVNVQLQQATHQSRNRDEDGNPIGAPVLVTRDLPITMPELNGRDNSSCAAIIIERGKLPDTPIIAMAADGLGKERAQASRTVLDCFENIPGMDVISAMRDNDPHGKLGTGHTELQNRIPSQSTAVPPSPMPAQAGKPSAASQSQESSAPPPMPDLPETLTHWGTYTIPFAAEDLPVLKARAEKAGYATMDNTGSGTLSLIIDSEQNKCRIVILIYPASPEQANIEYLPQWSKNAASIPEDLHKLVFAAAEEKKEKGFLAPEAPAQTHGGGHSGGGSPGTTGKEANNISKGELLAAGGAAAATSLAAYMAHRQSQPQTNGKQSKSSVFTKCAVAVGVILTGGLLASALSGGKISEKIRR